MIRNVPVSVFLFAATLTDAYCQWTLQDAHTSADLEAIDSVGGGIAWAGGRNGTVLRTEDNGDTWHVCAVPPEAKALDFGSVQGFSADTAIVMSVGRGDQSRLYETTDACRTWKLLFINPDKEGSWVGLRFSNKERGFVLGQPVSISGEKDRRIVLEETYDGGKTWRAWHKETPVLAIQGKDPVFVTSISKMPAHPGEVQFAVRGGMGSRTYRVISAPSAICDCMPPVQLKDLIRQLRVDSYPAPLSTTSSSGIYAIALATYGRLMVVGGDPEDPERRIDTAALSRVSGLRSWDLPQTAPNGYRSAVSYDAKQNVWIAVGPNGTDISTDEGTNWRQLKPSVMDVMGADTQWTSLSLPFVVGPRGRIGRLETDALK